LVRVTRRVGKDHFDRIAQGTLRPRSHQHQQAEPESRRGDFAVDARLRRAIPRVLLASAAMAGALWLAQDALSGIAATNAALAAFVLAALVVIGLVAFAGAAVGFGAARLSDIKRLLDRSPG